MKAIHGGDLYRNSVVLDFSVNTNPLGVPNTVTDAMLQAVKVCDKYPDIVVEKLTKSVSIAYSIPSEYLLFGNGSSELFMAVVHAIAPQKTVIPVPSFYGYAYAAGAADTEIVSFETKAEHAFCMTTEICSVLTEDVDLLFLANPNNPTGTIIEKELLKQILNHCKDKHITVVLDECFVEFCDGAHTILSEIKAYDNLILVRAFTKIFSVPGVRLGYLVCSNQKLLETIKRHIPEWNLSCFAQAAGCACCDLAGKTDFIRKTVSYVKKERQFLEKAFYKRGIRFFPSEANFILIDCEEPLYERLLEQGILIRDCSNFKGLRSGYYRIAVKSRAENETLLNAIDAIKQYHRRQ